VGHQRRRDFVLPGAPLGATGIVHIAAMAGGAVGVELGGVSIRDAVPITPIPTTSEWGLLGVTTLLLTAGVVLLRLHRARPAGLYRRVDL
jgi:hypothetical protein